MGPNLGTNNLRGSLNSTNKLIIQQDSTINKFNETEIEFITFFNKFFYRYKGFSLARILKKDTSGFSVVTFDSDKKSLHMSDAFLDTTIEDYECYLDYLYSLGVNNIEVLSNISYSYLQNIIKASLVEKDLSIIEPDISERDNVFSDGRIELIDNTSSKILFWNINLFPSFFVSYLKRIKREMDLVISKGKINPNFEEIYSFFKDNPRPNMKILEYPGEKEKKYFRITRG